LTIRFSSIKFAPPAISCLANTLERERLLSKLREGYSKRITLVTAGAGTGKTTLTAQFALKCQHQIIWIGLSKDDSEFSEFVQLLFYGIQKRNPGSGETLYRFLTGGNISGKSIRHLALLFIDLLESLPELLLVIDDFHSVDMDKNILKLMQYLIEELPPHIHIILLSRRSFPFPDIPRWSLRKWLVEIAEAELYMTLNEIKEVMALWKKPPPLALISSQLHQISSGWIGAIILLTDHLKTAEDAAKFISQKLNPADKELMLDYIIQEVIGNLPKQMRDFVIRSAVLQRLVPHELDEFLDISDSLKILTYLEKNNFLVQRVSDSKLEFRYHDLLIDAVMILLDRQYSSKRKNVLLCSCAEYIRSTNPLLSMKRFLDAEKPEKAVSVLLDYQTSIHDKTDSPGIDSIIFRIPETYYDSLPDLLLLRANAEFRHNNISKAENYYKKAMDMYFRESRIRKGLMAAMNYMDMLQYLARFGDLKSVAENISGYLNNENDDIRIKMELLIAFIPGNTASPDKMRKLLEQNLEFEKKRNSILGQALAYFNLAGQYYVPKGEFEKAIELFERQIPILERYGTFRMVSLCWFNLGQTCQILKKWESAERAFTNSYNVSKKYNLDVLKTPAMTGIAETKTSLGQYNEALNLLKQVESLYSCVPMSYQHARYIRGFRDYYCAVNNEKQAISYAEKLNTLAIETQSENLVANAFSGMGDVLVEFHRFDEASECYEKSFKTYKKFKKYYWIALGLLSLSRRLQYEQHQETIAILERALAIIKENHFDYIFTKIHNENNLNLLSIAIKNNLETEYISRLFLSFNDCDQLIPLLKDPDNNIRKLVLNTLIARGLTNKAMKHIIHIAEHGTPQLKRLAETALIKDAKQPAISLTVKCFGKFELNRAKNSIPAAAWKLRRALNIFKYLLIHQSQPIHKELLIDIFWPDSSAKHGLTNLYRAIGCIRNVIEPDIRHGSQSSMLTLSDHHYTLVLSSDSYIDFQHFKKILFDLQNHLRSSAIMTSFNLFVHADKIYNGEFLMENRYEEWVIELRESFRQEFIYLGLQLAESLFKAGALTEVTEIIGMLGNRDPLREEIISLKMKVLIEQKQIPACRKVFEKYKELLQRELSCDPSDYLEQMYKHLDSSR